MTLPFAIAAGSQILGGILSYGEQRAARRRQNQAMDLAATGYTDIENLINSRLNSGQDSFLQYLRANPNALKPFQFDASSAFKQLQGQDIQNTADQVAGLRSSVGSLGERFGSGFASREAILRARIGVGLDARNAGISQSSFENALQAGLTDYNSRIGQNNQLIGILANLRSQSIGQQIGLLTSPQPSFGATLAGTGGDIAQLMVLQNYLKGSSQQRTPAYVPSSFGGYTTPVSYTLPPTNFDPTLRFRP
jgi:hypothetical protein